MAVGTAGVVGWYRGLPPRARYALTAGVALALVLVLMTSSVGLAPAGSRVAAWWPAAGLSVALVLWARSWWRWVVVALLTLVSLAANVLGGRPLSVASGFALANSAEAVTVALLLLRSGDPRRALASMVGLFHLVRAVAAGALVIGVGAGLTVALTETGDPFAAGRAAAASHGAAVLIVLPWFLGVAEGARRSRLERVAQWSAVLLVPALVFAPPQSLPLAFVPFVPLMWGAVRMDQRTVFVQLLATGLLATVLTTTGGGAFGHLGQSHSPEVVTALVQAFLVCSALLVLPLSVAVVQRQETLAALTRSEALYRHAFNSALLGMLLLRRHGDVLVVEEVNGVALRLLTGSDGRDEDAVVGSRWGDFFLGDEVPADACRDDAGEARAWHGEARVAAGPRPWVQVSLSPLVEHSEDLFTAQLVDVTGRREAEDHLRAALDAERVANEQLTELDRAKSDFVTNISHELRTPITSVIGYAEMLASGEAGDLDRVQLSMVEKVQRNATRLLALIEDVLAVSRVDAGSFTLTLEEVNLRAVVWQACEVLDTQARDAGVTVRVALPHGPVQVVGDKAQLERALINLVSNAVKFTPSGGEVTVRVRRAADAVTIAVEDTGMGVPEDEAHRLFERFFRSSTAQVNAVQGTGIGLTLVASIAHAHHGEVGYEPRPGGGSVFSLTLPHGTLPQQREVEPAAVTAGW